MFAALVVCAAQLEELLARGSKTVEIELADTEKFNVYEALNHARI